MKIENAFIAFLLFDNFIDSKSWSRAHLSFKKCLQFNFWSSWLSKSRPWCLVELLYLVWRYVTRCDVMSRGVTSCHVVWRHVTWCDVISRGVTSCHVVWRHDTWCDVTFCRSLTPMFSFHSVLIIIILRCVGQLIKVYKDLCRFKYCHNMEVLLIPL